MPRAQTTLDFLVGTTVFLLTVTAVLVTVPGLVDPFAAGSESHTITADRTAETLATDRLVSSPADPYVFHADRVDGFFADNESVAMTELGLPSSVSLNVTLSNETTQLHALGPTPGEDADASVAWRAGQYRNDYAELVVRVW